ncbi:MAG TPA: hypothetical protein VGA55_02435, partial [Bacteroidota bacterium]
FQSIYCTWSRIALISAALVANPDDGAIRQSAAMLGAQADFRLVIFSSFESTFSVGYAAAVVRNQRLSDEVMISLKILR